MTYTFTVPALFDTHIHFREGDIVASLIAHAVEGGGRIFCPQPNTVEGLKTATQTINYLQQLRRSSPVDKVVRFIPFAMLTEETTSDDIDEWASAGVRDCKVYPRYRTTQSEYGIVNYGRIIQLVSYCGEKGIRVHFHPEHPDKLFSNRVAERMFLPLMQVFMYQAPETVFFWEHGRDRHCIPFWKKWAKTGRFFVTATAHHLLTNDDLAYGDVRQIFKPTAGEESDRQALVDLVKENHLWLMAGSDAAYHPQDKKFTMADGCACGAYTYDNIVALYADVLHDLILTESGRECFGRFISGNAEAVYGIRNSASLTLEGNGMPEFQIPQTYKVANEVALAFWADRKLRWRIAP